MNVYEKCFREYAKREVKEVLDAACDSGGPMLELARRGYVVIGADLHEEVVEIARRKAIEAGLDIKFIVCDARELDKFFSESSFDVVTMFFSSINYMTSWKDLMRLLRSVKYVLRSGGIFIADAQNPYEYMFRLSKNGEGRPITWSVERY